MIKRFTLEVERKDAYDAAFEIAKGSGLLKELYEDKTVEGLSRYENVQELLNAIKEFVEDPERQEKTLGAVLAGSVACHRTGRRQGQGSG
jgi:DNA helicase-2/ATP-dependent DNA helicase PcrA